MSCRDSGMVKAGKCVRDDSIKQFSIPPHPTYSERSVDQQGVDYMGYTRESYIKEWEESERIHPCC